MWASAPEPVVIGTKRSRPEVLYDYKAYKTCCRLFVPSSGTNFLFLAVELLPDVQENCRALEL